jgi:hypothetical protein
MSDKTYNTNLASEFYVLAALHRLGLDAVLTLGNKKSVDLAVVRDAGDSVTVDVKRRKREKKGQAQLAYAHAVLFTHPSFGPAVTHRAMRPQPQGSFLRRGPWVFEPGPFSLFF